MKSLKGFLGYKRVTNEKTFDYSEFLRLSKVPADSLTALLQDPRTWVGAILVRNKTIGP